MKENIRAYVVVALIGIGLYTAALLFPWVAEVRAQYYLTHGVEIPAPVRWVLIVGILVRRFRVLLMAIVFIGFSLWSIVRGKKTTQVGVRMQ